MPLVPTTQPPPAPLTGLGLLDALLRTIHHDPFGGLGTVLNPESLWAQQLQKYLPTVYQSLGRSPLLLKFIEGQPLFGKAATRVAFPEGQIIAPENAGLQTLMHEGLHGLYGGKTAGATLMPPAKHGLTILNHLVPNELEREALLNMYSGNEAHAALHAMAGHILERQGLKPVGMGPFVGP